MSENAQDHEREEREIREALSRLEPSSFKSCRLEGEARKLTETLKARIEQGEVFILELLIEVMKEEQSDAAKAVAATVLEFGYETIVLEEENCRKISSVLTKLLHTREMRIDVRDFLIARMRHTLSRGSSDIPLIVARSYLRRPCYGLFGELLMIEAMHWRVFMPTRRVLEEWQREMYVRQYAKELEILMVGAESYPYEVLGLLSEVVWKLKVRTPGKLMQEWSKRLSRANELPDDKFALCTTWLRNALAHAEQVRSYPTFNGCYLYALELFDDGKTQHENAFAVALGKVLSRLVTIYIDNKGATALKSSMDRRTKGTVIDTLSAGYDGGPWGKARRAIPWLLRCLAKTPGRKAAEIFHQIMTQLISHGLEEIILLPEDLSSDTLDVEILLQWVKSHAFVVAANPPSTWFQRLRARYDRWMSKEVKDWTPGL